MTAAIDLFGRTERERGSTRQLALPLAWRGRRDDAAPLLVTDPLRALIDDMVGWQHWAAPVAVLYGPARSGKSLLAEHVARNAGAVSVLDPGHEINETALFHACTAAMAEQRPLLLVALLDWQAAMPDLATRMSAAQTFTVPTPDADLLASLLVRRLAERQILLPQNVAGFVAQRMVRSFAALDALCDVLTHHWQADSAPLSLPRVRGIVGNLMADCSSEPVMHGEM